MKYFQIDDDGDEEVKQDSDKDMVQDGEEQINSRQADKPVYAQFEACLTREEYAALTG